MHWPSSVAVTEFPEVCTREVYSTGKLICVLFSIPVLAHAQGCESFTPGDPVDFDANTGLWHNWQTGADYLLDPYAQCNGGAYSGLGWGYGSSWDARFWKNWFDNGNDTYSGMVESVDTTQAQLQCASGFRPAQLIRVPDGYVVSRWCDPLPEEPAAPRPLQDWGQISSMFFDWALGLGPDNRAYYVGSIQVAEMRRAPGIENARGYWEEKNANALNAGDCSQAQSVRNYDVGFGLQGLHDSGGNATEQFVGSYSVDISQNHDGSWHFKIYNVTSMESFLYGLGPDWERTYLAPGGNMRQTYEWDEWLC